MAQPIPFLNYYGAGVDASSIYGAEYGYQQQEQDSEITTRTPKNPVQTECGHLFCKGCLESVLKQGPPICPLDSCSKDISKNRVFHDNARRMEILQLDVYCNYKPIGCEWMGPFKELKAHIDNDCSEVFRPCPNPCGSPTMKLPQLQQHLAVKDGQCPESEIPCPFKDYGCSAVSLRKNMPAHLEQYSVFHCQLQADCFVELKQQADKNTAATQHLLERVGSLETRLNAVKRLQDALKQRVELLDDRRERHSDRYAGRIEVVEDQTARITNTIAQLQKCLDEVRDLSASSGYFSGRLGATASITTTPGATASITTTPGATASVTTTPGATASITTTPSATASVTTTPGATASITTTPSATASITTTPGSVTPRRIENVHSKVTELEHSVDRCLSSNMDQELRLQLLERATYSGILIWKIDDFERRRKEAVDGVTMSLYSSPFYTSRHGYKMCARIYLNGDGLGKNTHFSFFFVIMRGLYDALLPWPFRQKVTLTLLNQTGKKHVTDHFRPDPHSSSFQRPGKREMNVASGCPMFIRIEHLLNGGFVKDNAAFIRIVVDTEDLPPDSTEP